MGIVLKSERELAKMREAGRIVRAVLDAVEAACVPGATTAELNAIAERELRRAKATSAFLGYAPGGAPPYPAVLCTSVNAVVGAGARAHVERRRRRRSDAPRRLRTVVTADASLSAHVEHTVSVTDDGPRVLTAA
jgi:methionine aminopeptidase